MSEYLEPGNVKDASGELWFGSMEHAEKHDYATYSHFVLGFMAAYTFDKIAQHLGCSKRSGKAIGFLAATGAGTSKEIIDMKTRYNFNPQELGEWMFGAFIYASGAEILDKYDVKEQIVEYKEDLIEEYMEETESEEIEEIEIGEITYDHLGNQMGAEGIYDDVLSN